MTICFQKNQFLVNKGFLSKYHLLGRIFETFSNALVHNFKQQVITFKRCTADIYLLYLCVLLSP